MKEAEAAIPRLNNEIKALEAKLADPMLFTRAPDEFDATNARLEAARAELEKAEEEWLEIEAMKEALSS